MARTRGMTPPVLLAVLVAASAICVSGATDGASHVVVSESVSGVEVRVRFPAPAMKPRGAPDEFWTDITVADALTRWRVGEVALPGYVVLLALPVGTEPRLTVIEHHTGALPGFPPPPVLEWDPAAQEAFLRAPKPDEVPPGADLPAIEVETVGVVRHLRLARVTIRPVRYDFTTGDWSGTRDVRLRVAFEPTGSTGTGLFPVTPDAIDADLGAMVVNPSAIPASLATPSGSAGAGAGTTAIPETEPSVITPVMIATREAGMHAVRRADLEAAGVDVTGIDPATFVLTNRGEEIPVEVADGGDGSFDAPDDVIRFHAWKVGGEETRDNVYRLTGGVRAGLRMATRDTAPNGSDPQPVEFMNVAVEETNYEFWASLPESVPSPWYWERLSLSEPGVDVYADYSIEVSNRSNQPDTVGRLEVRVQSRSEIPGADPGHHVRVLFNGNVVDERTWTGLIGQVLSGDIPQSWVHEGANTVRVVNVADLGLTVQSELVDWIRLKYGDRFVAEGDNLAFGLEPPGPVSPAVEGFGGPEVHLYDVTDPEAPVALTGFEVRQDGATWTAEFSDDLQSAPARTEFVAVRDGAERSPQTLEPDLDPTALRDAAGAGADMLIVVWDGFLDAIQPLVSHRESQGLRVVVGKVGDVLDEFNGGIDEIQGIKNFVQWAFEHYTPPSPTYLLLVGDATFDPADFRNEGDDLVSTHLYRAPNLGIAPTDAWLGAVNGSDLLPDLAVGRISVRYLPDLQDYVANIVDYEDVPPVAALNSGLLYVADDNDPYFETVLDDVIATYQPPAMESRRVYLSHYPDTPEGTEATRDDLRASIDTGSLVTTWAGHGGRTLWGHEQLWRNQDVPTLGAYGHLTFVVALSCINGWFVNLDQEPYSLGETWNVYRDRGAAGSWATSALGTMLNYDRMIDQLFRHLFVLRENRLGYATWRALLDAHLRDGVPLDYVREMVYFGDPAALLPLDSDRDGRLGRDETVAGTDPDDVDSDDDGLGDGSEGGWNVDEDGDGLVNAADWDADDDGLPDGLEAGIDQPGPDTDTTAGHFVADVDPSSTTLVRSADSDGGGAPDGAEDRDVDGAVGGGETDPNLAGDDPACSASRPAEITGVRIQKYTEDVVVTWDPQTGVDPCVLYRVYIAGDPGRPDDFSKFDYAGTMTGEMYAHRGALLEGASHYYLVTGTSLSAGDGVLGHYGR